MANNVAFPSTPSKTAAKPTRTVAVLARACAKVHRLAIESKITAAGFEILVARQEEWAYPDDADFLYEFFHGHSDEATRKWIERLTGSVIYFLVLERVDAVKTWNQIVGPSDLDDDEAEGDYGNDDPDASFASRHSLPPVSSSSSSGSKLRDTYGKGLLYGSLSQRQANRQIATCAPEFASEEAIADLSMEYSGLLDAQEDEQSDQAVSENGSINAEAEVAAVEEQEQFKADEEGCVLIGETSIVYNEDGQAFDKATGGEVQLEEELLVPEKSPAKKSDTVPGQTHSRAPDGLKVFKARPVPSSVGPPKIQPRLSRAAALRMGVELPAVPIRVAAPAQPAGPVGISGLPKSQASVPKSLAQPAIKPRANRASLARTAGGGEATGSASPVRLRKQVDYTGTPGHKRQSMPGSGASTVASLANPTIAPRQNRASLARAGGAGGAAPQRTSSSSSGASADVAGLAAARRPTNDLARSQQQRRKANVSDENVPMAERKPVQFNDTPGHRRKSLAGSFNLASLKAPTIAPRANRASLARGGNNGAASSSERAEPSQPSQLSGPISSGTADPLSSSISSILSPSPDKASLGSRDRKPVDFSATPGHKRASTSVTVASLAAPKITPRSNLAASRRLSVGGAGASAPGRGQQGMTTGGSSRPASAMGAASAATAGSKGGKAVQARSSSSAGFRNPGRGSLPPHQDGHVAVPGSARLLSNARYHPPSAFRAVGTA